MAQDIGKISFKDRKSNAFFVLALFSTVAGSAIVAIAPQTFAQAQTQTRFSISAGPLNLALNAFGRQAGVQVTYLASILGGKMTSGFSGAGTREQVLNRILSSSGLVYSFPNSTTVAISLPAAGTMNVAPDGSTLLQTITVDGASGENAWGPVEGFVAHRSATATKTDTPIHETPQTINVVTADQMETFRPSKLAETLRYTPGVVSDFQSKTVSFDRVRVRGFYNINIFYLDGMQLTPSGIVSVAQIDPANLERVEVIKGPSSVLYGQNGTGSLINMVSKRPQETEKREIGFTFGNKNKLESTFDIGGALNGDKSFLYRISGIGTRSDTDIDGAKAKRLSIAPSFTWRPSTDTSLTVLSGFQYDPEGNTSAYFPISGTLLSNPNGQLPRSLNINDPSFAKYRRNQAYIGTIFEHNFNEDVQFRQNARYMHVDTSIDSLRIGSMKADQRTYSRSADSVDGKTDGFSVDNNLLYRFDVGKIENKLLIGFDYRYFNSTNETDTGTSSNLNIDVFNPSYGNLVIPTLQTRTDNRINVTQYGIYAQNQMAIDNWRFVAGLRQDWAKTETDNYLTNTTTELSDHALSGRAGLLYLFDNGLAPYLSYSTSFEPTSGTDYYGNTFKPSEGKQWEVGLKYEPQWFDGSFTVSLYDLRRQNVTTADNEHTCAVAPDLADCGNYSVQTGEVRVRGIEVESKITLTERLNASFGYAYMDAEVTKNNDGYQGNTPTNAPKHMASAWLDYTFNDGFLDGLTIGGGARYVGRMYADDSNLKSIPSYTLFDAMIAYDLGKLSSNLDGSKLTVSATNLADKKAVGGCWSSSYCDYVDGRSIVGSLKIKF